jgi:signal transduction histidine kinase
MINHNALTAWESQFNALFRNNSDGVIIADRTGTLLRINPAAASMLRTVPEEAVGKPSSAIFRKLPPLVSLLTGQGDEVRRIPLPAERIAFGFGVILDDGNRIVMLQDITEQEMLDSRREQLIERIGHDLRNPASAIYGFAELLLTGDPLTAEQEKLLRRISQTAQKLQNLVYTLIDLAWIESGMPFASIPVALDEVIGNAVEQLDARARKKQISIAVSIQQPMPIVMGDPMRLQQVVFNLLENAIVYSDDELPVAIHAFQENEVVRCTVADRGYGIPDSELSKVFGRMYRSERDAIRDTPGGGVGLTIAKVIIERHGGSIEASSTLGRGSTFMFTLPLAG